MTDQEFDILDALYFVQSFAYLQENTTYSLAEIKDTLKILLAKDWIRVYDEKVKEILHIEKNNFDMHYFDENCQKLHYLATKAGLMAHNSIH
jgi:hypothetical protein